MAFEAPLQTMSPLPPLPEQPGDNVARAESHVPKARAKTATGHKQNANNFFLLKSVAAGGNAALPLRLLPIIFSSSHFWKAPLRKPPRSFPSCQWFVFPPFSLRKLSWRPLQRAGHCLLSNRHGQSTKGSSAKK
jgi:hypothetical protein